MKTKNTISTFLGISLLSLAATTTHAAHFADKDQPFDSYSWVTTHNSYEKIIQNHREMPEQLNDGVRGFMLDLYPDNRGKELTRLKVCHKNLACYGHFGNHLKDEFLPFLKNNPSEVVTIFLETYITRDDLQQVFNALPELANYSFNPANFMNSRWPTLNEMAQKNNRLILMADSPRVSGDYAVDGKTVTVLYDKDWIVQNRWDTLGAIAFAAESRHNWSCPTRWDDTPLNTRTVDDVTGKQWNRLFLMNQFHHVTSELIDSAKYDNNLTYLMRRTANCGVTPNFIGINNYRSGDTLQYTKTLSEGGIYLWEGNNADKKQDAICAIPAGNKTLQFPTHGCENDEARSMSLSGVKKGTRITVFDNGDGNRSDDYAVIDIKRDIGIRENVVIGSFENNTDNNDYQIVYNRNNGLDGKVSRLEIGNTPTDFSDAAIAMYEGNNATQNLDCTVPFTSSHSFGMKSKLHGCSNDEIRSAKIMKAKAGTHFILRGHPDGRDSQGKAVVRIKRDIHFPVVIGSFDRNHETADFRIEKSGSGLDGKISHGEFHGAR